MNGNNFRFSFLLRPIFFLLPLLFGTPFLSYVLCSFNCVMTVLGSGPIMGAATGFITAAMAMFLCSAIGHGAMFGLFFALEILLVSAACAICTIKKASFTIGFMSCSIAYALPQLLSLDREAGMAGLSIADYITSGLSAVSEAVSTTSQLQEQLADPQFFSAVMDTVTKLLKMCLPGMLAITFAVSGYAVMWMVSAALRPTQFNNGHKFSMLHMRVSFMLFGAACILLMLIPEQTVFMVGLNGFILFLFGCFCCGMSLVEFFLQQKIKKRFSGIMIHAAILFFGLMTGLIFFVATGYCLLGITDAFISVRRRATANEKQ